MMSSTRVPDCEGAVVISCDELPPQNIIARIFGKEALPPAIHFSNVKGFLWNLETRYYTAEVYLYALEQQEKLEPKLCETIKAIIFYIDNTETSNFDDVKNWMPHLKDIGAEVQLLICHTSQEESKGRKSILNWCVQNQFELVELNSSADEEDDVTEKDVKGYNRVIQSLQSHLWAGLSMKEEKSRIRCVENGDLIDSTDISELQEIVSSGEEHAVAACNSYDSTPKAKKESEKTATKVKVENEELELDEQLLSNVLEGEDPGGESFEALFAKFASMKDRAAGLSKEERGKYAEKVAIAFWRAMGGDEDEIDGLEDD